MLPSHGSKEILVVYTSLSTCDPGDIFETIAFLKEAKIRVSVVGWGAELYILRKLATETQGTYHVALDKSHLQELLHDHCPPPPTLAKFCGNTAKLVCMGFPQKQSVNALSLCAW